MTCRFSKIERKILSFEPLEDRLLLSVANFSSNDWTAIRSDDSVSFLNEANVVCVGDSTPGLGDSVSATLPLDLSDLNAENDDFRLKNDPLDDETKTVEIIAQTDDANSILAVSVASNAASTDLVSTVSPTFASTLPQLSSKPDSSHIVYLDFDGQTTTGSLWNSSFNETEIVMPVYHLKPEETAEYFTLEDQTAIYEIWQIISEDYMPFDVNVTTVYPGDAAMSQPGIVRVCVGGAGDWYGSQAGGCSFINVFDYATDLPCFVFSDNLGTSRYAAESGSHEVGHMLGLLHDGQNSTEYYRGANGWAPIMGAGYNQELSQWSVGDYDGATQTQDDLDIISQKLGYRADDYGNSIATATALSLDGNVGWISGVIERSSDVDYFSFVSDGSEYDFWIGGERGITNLDVFVEIFNADGVSVATYDPLDTLYVEFLWNEPGTFYLAVSGTGKTVGDDVYYSDYGSLGAFSINVGYPKTLTVTTELDVIADDGLLSLREAVLFATSRTTIRFDDSLRGKTIQLSGSQIKISKDVIVDASDLLSRNDATGKWEPGIVVDAGGLSRIFCVASVNWSRYLYQQTTLNVQIDGLRLTGGSIAQTNDYSGGAIYNAGRLTVSNSLIDGNYASRGGGGIACDNGGTLTINDCYIENNSTDIYGGGVYCEMNSRSTIVNSAITSNSAAKYGGGICFKGTTQTLVSCSIAGNSAGESYGSGVFNYEGTLLLYNSIVAVNKQTVDVYSKSNQIFAYYSLSTYRSWNVDSTERDASCGNVVYNWRLPLFLNATSGDYRLIVDSQAIATGNNAYLVYPDGSAISNDLSGQPRLFHETVDCGAFEFQGVILAPPTVAEAIPSVFSADVAWNAVENATGYLLQYSTDPSFATFVEKSFDASLATTLDGLDSLTTYYIRLKSLGTGRFFSSNWSETTEFKTLPRTIVVDSVGDVVDPDDGVTSLREAILDAQETETIVFDASLAGQTISLTAGQISISRSITIDASSLGESGIKIDAGGASSILNVSAGTESNPVVLNNLTLTNGKTKWYGGLLYNSGNLAVLNGSFVDGFAYYGGAIGNAGTLSLQNCVFTENFASFGGAIFNRSGGILTISSIDATLNRVTNNGGVLYNNGTATLTDSTFESNESSNRAGAIYVAAGSVSVVSSTFLRHSAKNYAGTFYNAGTLEIADCSISEGSAIYGGAIANFKTLTVSRTDFLSNVATRQGGAIYHSSSIEATITDSFISGNSANQGGGLFVRIGTVRLTGSEMKTNVATLNGGAIYNQNQVVLTNCLVSENNARYYGGGIYNKKIARLNGTTSIAGNSTGTAKWPDVYTKSGGQLIVSSVSATNAVFEDFDAWNELDSFEKLIEFDRL